MKAPESGSMKVPQKHFDTLKVATAKYVDAVVKANDNNISKAARVLGISRATIYNLMKGDQE